MAGLPVLKAAPELAPRSQTVDCPELGGAVVVRGLLASEVFAISGLRSQALRRVREARAEYAERVASMPAGAEPPPFEPPALGFEEMRLYGRYTSQLLACAVTVENGMSLYTADQWEVVGQHHPGLPPRLHAVAEALSGLNVDDVEKNSPPTPS